MYHNYTYCVGHLKCIEIWKRCVVYQELTQSIILQKQTDSEKENRVLVNRGGVWGNGKLDEDSQKYKLPVIREMSTRDVMYNMINIINTAVCYL